MVYKIVLVLKNNENKIIETKVFPSRVQLENYIATKYDNNVYDWTIKTDLFEIKGNDKLARIHTVVLN